VASEDIIIIPANGIINFYDRNNLLTEWVIDNGTFNFKRGGQTYLSMDNTYPNYRVNTNLKVSVINIISIFSCQISYFINFIFLTQIAYLLFLLFINLFIFRIILNLR
jgi:hypothetical protein